MAIPQFRSEGVDQNGTTTSVTPSFSGFTFQSNDIIEIVFATDGTLPTLSTANGFAIAQDPSGNTAQVSTSGGAAGAAECCITVFWKRAASTTDSPPVINTNGATCWCLQPNSFSGARTSGTPYNAIATQVVSTATANITSAPVTSTLANCLFMPRIASSNDDQAFNNWTMTGSANPSGTQPVVTGWHVASGNACAFVGDEGGFAAAGGPGTATSTFGASTKQASVTLVMASLPEPLLVGDDTLMSPVSPAQGPRLVSVLADDELVQATASFVDEDIAGSAILPFATRPTISILTDDEIATTIVVSVVSDEDLIPLFPARAAFTSSVQLDDSDQILTQFIVEVETSSTPPPHNPLAAPWLSLQDDEQGTPTVTQSVEDEERRPAWLPAPPLPPQLYPDVVEIVPQSVVAGIGGGGDAQRSFQAPPQTGTLTTIAPIPAWTTSHAYVIDPTAGGTNRIQNGGNLYQCTQDGTSATSGGGPTGTGTAITDGTTRWRYIGAVQATDTAAGSQILATVMRGNQSQSASVTPTDNDSGTFTLITNNAYTSFPASFAGVWYRSTASNAKTSYQASGVWGGSGGAGDEMSIGWVELQGVKLGAPHAFSQVERGTSSGGTVTAAPITITKRCMIVSYWFGNGTVQAAGSPDAATPAGGLTLIPNTSAFLSLTPSGYIQHMVGWRMANPGTYSEVWTASPTDEGAQLVTVAFEDLSGGSIVADDDVFVPWMQPVEVSYRPSAWTVRADEIVSSAVAVEDEVWMPRLAMASAVTVQVRAEVDEVAVVVVDEEMVAPIASVRVARPVVQVADDEIAAPAVVQDHETIPAILPTRLWLAPYQADIDDITAAPLTTIGLDDDGPLPQPVLTPAWQPVAVWLDDVLHGIARGHVQIHGTAPDPEVYDYTGMVQVPELYR